MSMYEIDEAAKTITEAVHPDANIIFGAMIDEAMQGEIKITVIATGFGEARPRKKEEAKEAFTLTSLADLSEEKEGGEKEEASEIEGPLVKKPEFKEESEEEKEEEEDIEVPAFIRRKLK